MADQTHVLFVEDDDVIREATQLTLERDGFAVTAMPDGLSGLEAFRADRPDIALLDVMVPGLDGVSLCRIRDESTVPVIMLSARADAIDVVLGLEAGADDYVTKPFDGAVLVARIRAVLRRFERAAGAGGGLDDADAGPVLAFGELEIDTEGMEVRKATGRAHPDRDAAAARVLRGAGHRPHPRQAVGAGLGVRLGRGHPGGRRPCAAAAREDRPGPDRDGPRLRLQAEGLSGRMRGHFRRLATAFVRQANIGAGLRWKLSAAIALVGVLVAVALSLVVHNAARVSMLDNARDLADERIMIAQRNYELSGRLNFPNTKIDDPQLPAELRAKVEQGRRATYVADRGGAPDIWAAVPLKNGHVMSLHSGFTDRSSDILKDLDQALWIGSLATVFGGCALGVLIGGHLSRRLRKAATAANRVAGARRTYGCGRPSAGWCGTRRTTWPARWTPWRTRCGNGWRPNGG